jgi:hypothetical protein
VFNDPYRAALDRSASDEGERKRPQAPRGVLVEEGGGLVVVWTTTSTPPTRTATVGGTSTRSSDAIPGAPVVARVGTRDQPVLRPRVFAGAAGGNRTNLVTVHPRSEGDSRELSR